VGGLKVTYRGNGRLIIVEDDEVHVMRHGSEADLKYPDRVTDKQGNPIFPEEEEV
jgi:hypothetical protein